MSGEVARAARRRDCRFLSCPFYLFALVFYNPSVAFGDSSLYTREPFSHALLLFHAAAIVKVKPYFRKDAVMPGACPPECRGDHWSPVFRFFSGGNRQGEAAFAGDHWSPLRDLQKGGSWTRRRLLSHRGLVASAVKLSPVPSLSPELVCQDDALLASPV